MNLIASTQLIYSYVGLSVELALAMLRDNLLRRSNNIAFTSRKTTQLARSDRRSAFQLKIHIVSLLG